MSVPRRKAIRLEDYDYSTCGAYFVTCCVANQKNLLRNTADCDAKSMPALTKIGEAVEHAINNIGSVYSGAEVTKYSIMPDHLHMIVFLDGSGEKSPNLSEIIRQFKSNVTKRIGQSIWQKSFYDRVIRNEREYQEVWRYIDENELKWKLRRIHNVWD